MTETRAGTTPADLGLPEARLTDELIAKAREMVGLKLRPERYVQHATLDTLTNFVNGMGDVNPLYRDREYARWTRHEGLVAHPCFIYARHWPGRSRYGLPGIHGFYAGNDIEWFRAIRPGDEVHCMERMIALEEKESRFSQRLALQYVEAIYTNQRDDVVARVIGWCTRHERRAARDQKKYGDVPPRHEYPPAELDAIEAEVLGERSRIRGGETRYWEDVTVGEELPPILRGPLSMMDMMGWLVGTGRARTHGVLLEEARRHPLHYFRNPEASGGVEYTGIGHHRDAVAQQVGVPGTYDYGPQRTSWIGSLVTNWMGDDAFLKRLRVETRRFNVMGDTTWVKGRVVRKYVERGYPLVDLEIRAENQRGEATAPGEATVMLPSRDVTTEPVIDGRDLRLRRGWPAAAGNGGGRG